MNPPSDSLGLEFTPPAPPGADVAAASSETAGSREEGDAPLEEPEGLSPVQKALWDKFSRVCGSIGTAAAIEAFRRGFKAVGIPIPGAQRRPPSQNEGFSQHLHRTPCPRPATQLTPAQTIVWEKYEALCAQYGHEVAVKAVRTAFAAVELPVPVEFEQGGAIVDDDGETCTHNPVAEEPAPTVPANAGPAITQEGVVLAAPEDLSPQQTTVWNAFVDVAKSIGATSAVNSYKMVFANLGISLPTVTDTKPGSELLTLPKKESADSHSESADLVEPAGLNAAQKKTWDSFVQVAGKLGIGAALNSFTTSFEVLGIPLPAQGRTSNEENDHAGGDQDLVQKQVRGSLVEPEGLNATQKQIWTSFASLVNSIGYERAAQNYQHAFKNLKMRMPANPSESDASNSQQVAAASDVSAAPPLPAPAFALTEKEQQAKVLREREPSNLSKRQKNLWDEMVELTKSLGVALAAASYSFAFENLKLPMPDVDSVIATASAAVAPGSPGSPGSRSDGGNHVALKEPDGLNASQKALWNSFANMVVPMMGLASAIQMYKPQLKAFGIPIPAIGDDVTSATTKDNGVQRPRLETPAGLNASQLQVWNTFANTVIISVGVKVAVQTYGPAFKALGIPMPADEVLADFEAKLKANANSTTRSVYAMSERVRQMQDLGPDQDRGLYEAVTGFAAQLNMLGPEAVHYQISLRRMLAAIAKDCHTPGNLASVLQKADTELREAMVEGPHRLPRLEKQIRRAVEAELLEFGTFEVGSGVPTPGGVFVTAESDLSSPSTPVITPGTHSEPIPAMACAAFGLLCSGLVEAPAVRDARRHGGSRADLDYCMFAETADEICDPANGGGSWSKEKGNALLLCAHLSSFLSGPSRERTPLDRFLRIRNICASHMETITHELTGLEKAMRDSGEFNRLAALEAPEATRRAGRLRQDAEDVLGLHPDFVKFQEAFTRPPVLKTSSNMKMYVGLPLALLDVFDPDLQAYCRGAISLYENELLKVQLTEGELSLNFQPYILFLITIGRRVNPYFQQYIHDLVGGPPRYKGNPLRAKIKGFSRMKEKQEDKYTHLDYAMPSCSVMCDVVRCLIECASPEDLEEMFHVICEKMEVVRVKNGFAEDEVPFGFRQILMNVRYTTPETAEYPGVTMICEVQLNLASYVHVKHKIHKLYSVARCTHNCAHQPDLRLQLMKQAMSF